MSCSPTVAYMRPILVRILDESAIRWRRRSGLLENSNHAPHREQLEWFREILPVIRFEGSSPYVEFSFERKGHYAIINLRKSVTLEPWRGKYSVHTRCIIEQRLFELTHYVTWSNQPTRLVCLGDSVDKRWMSRRRSCTETTVRYRDWQQDASKCASATWRHLVVSDLFNWYPPIRR